MYTTKPPPSTPPSPRPSYYHHRHYHHHYRQNFHLHDEITITMITLVAVSCGSSFLFHLAETHERAHNLVRESLPMCACDLPLSRALSHTAWGAPNLAVYRSQGCVKLEYHAVSWSRTDSTCTCAGTIIGRTLLTIDRLAAVLSCIPPFLLAPISSLSQIGVIISSIDRHRTHCKPCRSSKVRIALLYLC